MLCRTKLRLILFSAGCLLAGKGKGLGQPHASSKEIGFRSTSVPDDEGSRMDNHPNVLQVGVRTDHPLAGGFIMSAGGCRYDEEVGSN
jgi:hypothetical protein